MDSGNGSCSRGVMSRRANSKGKRHLIKLNTVQLSDDILQGFREEEGLGECSYAGCSNPATHLYGLGLGLRFIATMT